MRRGDGDLTLFVETADGTWVRRIQAASPLRSDIKPGYAAEEATRSAAARWGLPDFIFRPALSTKGRGVLEVGDALLIAGDLAACVQVKMRTSPSDNDHRERLWLDKKIDAAQRQALGSLRRMQQLGTLLLVNERGREVTIDTARPRWTSVVILDHPGVEDYVPRSSSSLVVLRRDWEFLFSQLKSTYAVLQYLHHISRARDSTPLGDEPVRYYQVAQASLTKEPDPPDERIVAQGTSLSAPVFPLAPAGAGEIVRWVLEDIATLPVPAGLDPAALLTVLAAVDSIPLAFREDLGTQIRSWFEEIVAIPGSDATYWRSRRFVSATYHHLIFGVCNRRWSDDVQGQFSTLVQLRHQEHLERTPERDGLMTVGVLLTPRTGGWDTTMVATSGEQGIDEETRRILEKLWGTWDAPGTDPALTPGSPIDNGMP